MSSTDLIKDFARKNKGLVSAYFMSNIIILFLETIVLSIILNRIFESKSLDYYSIRNFIVIFIIIKIFTTLRNHVYDLIVPEFQKFIKTSMYNSIIDKYKINYKDLNIGYVLYNFQNMPVEFTKLLIETLQEYIPNSIAILLCIGFLLYLNPVIGIISLFGLIACILVMITRSSKNINLSLNDHNLSKNDNEFIQDKLNNLFNIYLSGTEDDEKQNYEKTEEILKEAIYDDYNFHTESMAITNFITVVAALIIFIKAKNITNLVLVILVTVQYIAYLTKFSNDLTHFINMIGYIKHSNTFMENIVKNYNIPSPDTGLLSSAELYGDIRFKNVTFRYDNTDKNVLDNIDLLIKKGTSFAIYGKSGSGKSTIIKLLLGFYRISSGEITLNNINIKTIEVGALRKDMSMVSQTIKIFEGTVLENILYGSNVTENELVKKYSKQLRIFEKLKNGIHTQLTINGSTLSGGQKQIIGVLRAFLKDTPYLILDEPTVGLDKDTKKLLLDTVKNIKNKTVIYVTHDYDVKNYVDESYELINGKLIKIN